MTSTANVELRLAVCSQVQTSHDSLVCKDTADNSREWVGSGGATDLDDVVGEGVLAEHLQRAAVVQQAPDLPP